MSERLFKTLKLVDAPRRTPGHRDAGGGASSLRRDHPQTISAGLRSMEALAAAAGGGSYLCSKIHPTAADVFLGPGPPAAFLAVTRATRPYKSPVQKRFTMEKAKDA